MGVPKFFRYISERYPCLSELAREHSIPEFDNLYLDMNGIIHNCTHPDEANIHFHMEEADIFKEIFNYIDKLFYLIKPQRLFFLAIDGVAPRAKMNQQRSRRFRSAREAEKLEQQAKQRGEVIAHEPFDKNCITPGTVFMTRLQESLRNFLRFKISTDVLWQKCRVILSGQEVPGEGEHKIMDYIRYLKAQANFDPNTRHCLYGLDADLIILGLCTHELHFVVLREEVKFGKSQKRTSASETRFFLLHLGLLREYLELEFHAITVTDKSFDVAKLIDDWVLMGLMVGNDFIPHLPCLHISSNALPLLYETYIKVYPKLGGNINVHGKLNLKRLEIFLEELTNVEIRQFEDNFDDLKYMNAKTEAFDCDVQDIKQSIGDDLSALIDNSMDLYEGDSEDEDNLMQEFRNFKTTYYRTKFSCHAIFNDGLVNELTRQYITALQWVLDYYYRGVQSWDWYYPFHYAPFISDLRNIEKINIDFKLGTPFLPFQQLLAVLPAASCKLLPTVYHDLMTNPASPLAVFYPEDFEYDLNGKKRDWEAVVLIPFIDEKLLLSAMLPLDMQLSKTEVARNTHGPMYQYDYTDKSVGSMQAKPPLKALKNVYCTELAKWSQEIVLDLPQTVCVELPNAARHVFFPGFPTMKHLPFDFEIRCDRVRVFDQPSRSQNLVLMPKKRDFGNVLEEVASKFLQQEVYIGWPHLIKAKVIKIANRNTVVDDSGVRKNVERQFDMECKTLQEHFTTRMGIKYPNYDVLVYIQTYAGQSIEFGPKGQVQMKNAWSSTITAYPAQGVVFGFKVRDNMEKQFAQVEELFPTGSEVFFIGPPYYGSKGTVLDPHIVKSCGRLQVNITVQPEPILKEAQRLQNIMDSNIITSYDMCDALGINSKCLGRLTCSFFVVLGPKREKLENMAKHNIGLQLRYPKQNEERSDYCRRIDNVWQYTSLAQELIKTYCEKFGNVVHFLCTSNVRNELVFEEDIFPNAVGRRHIEEVSNWVRAQPHMKTERVACGSKTICKSAVEAILSAVDVLKAQPVKNVTLQVKPHLLVVPNVTLPHVYKSRYPVNIFDRVIVVRTIHMVPVGIKGTVVGIHPVMDPNPVRLECVRTVETLCEVLFDACVPNTNDIHGIAEERVFMVPESALVFITNFNDLEKQKTQAKAQAKTQSQPPANGAVNWREQYDQDLCNNARYVTAAGSSKHLITMKTQIPDEFVKPAVHIKKRDIVENWRTQQQPREHHLQQQQPQKQRELPLQQTPQPMTLVAQLPLNMAQGHAAESNSQTQALKSLLGMAKSTAELSNKAARPLQPPTQVFPKPEESPMPILPPPPAYWRRQAQLQEQQEQQEQLVGAQILLFPLTKSEEQTISDSEGPSTSHTMWRQPPQAQPLQQTTINNNGSFFKNNQRYNNSTINNQIPRSSSSIQDFVPIQAYRPKKQLHRKSPPNVPIIKDFETAPQEKKTEEASSTANINKSEDSSVTCPVSNPQKVQRKPRKPRIGAKFDVDYITPQ